jgi:hypothetical protein
MLKKEIGSFLELSFSSGNEYYTGAGIARLNTGRAGIYHSAKVLGCNTVYLPLYQCDTVRNFLLRKGMKIKYYSIDWEFNPEDLKPKEDEAVVLVNYYGIMSSERMGSLASRYQKAILDNSQAFFATPIPGAMNVYSARKFIGTPDGAYVIGENAECFVEEYEQDYSSDTSLFLLLRIEYGCEGKAYEARRLNEDRIDQSDIRRMSKLTHTILDGTNYEVVKGKRRDNFAIAHGLFTGCNRINPMKYYREDCVPMVYPLVIEEEGILESLIQHKIFQGHWWNYLKKETAPASMENWLSSYLIPITIDQRYGEQEIIAMNTLINEEQHNAGMI